MLLTSYLLDVADGRALLGVVYEPNASACCRRPYSTQYACIIRPGERSKPVTIAGHTNLGEMAGQFTIECLAIHGREADMLFTVNGLPDDKSSSRRFLMLPGELTTLSDVQQQP